MCYFEEMTNSVITVIAACVIAHRVVFAQSLNSSNSIVTGFPQLNQILENMLDFSDQLPGNQTECDSQLRALVESVTTLKNMWAIRMVDAWGKLPSGILEGNFNGLGSYDECKKIDQNTEDVGHVRGQYCLLAIPLKPPIGRSSSSSGFPSVQRALGLNIGTCFPDSCDAQQLESVLKSSFGALLNTSDIKLMCEVPTPDMGTKEIVAIVIFSIIAMIITLSTVYEALTLIRSREPNETLAMFSIYSNGIKLFTMTDRPKQVLHQKSDQIDCLNGIRAISMAWIVFSHNYMMLITSPLYNMSSIYDWITSYHSMLVIGSTVSVDAFFLLSGILVCWSLLKELDRNRKLNLPLMYLHRYLRLTPALAALILLTALMKYLGSGPFWNSTITATLEKPCDKYWWSALLYVQNYVNSKEICLGHTWYLSVDMQLYLISPLIIYPLWRWGRKVLIAIAGLILLSMGCVLATFLVKELRLAFVDPQSGGRNRMKLTYKPTHTRMGAWLVGVILGYILRQTKNRQFHLSKATIVSGWLISLTIMLAIIFGDYPLQQPDSYNKHPLIIDAIYESTNRVVWAGCLGWMVFACVNGYGGPINTFLSLSIWQPLGRISYSIYLVHLPLQALFTASLKNTIRFGDVIAVHKFWGDFGLAATVAVFWSLAFESPIVGLEKLLFGRLKKSRPEKPLVAEEQLAGSASGSTASLPSKDPV